MLTTVTPVKLEKEFMSPIAKTITYSAVFNRRFLTSLINSSIQIIRIRVKVNCLWDETKKA
jgi:hypothetical protein